MTVCSPGGRNDHYSCYGHAKISAHTFCCVVFGLKVHHLGIIKLMKGRDFQSRF